MTTKQQQQLRAASREFREALERAETQEVICGALWDAVGRFRRRLENARRSVGVEPLRPKRRKKS